MTTEEYRAGYDRMAADIIAFREETGRQNPFIEDESIMTFDRDTELVMRRFVRPGERILDVGCQFGNLLARFPDLERHGVDIAEAYLPTARERGITAIVAEAEALPYPDGWFDAVYAADILEHVHDLNLVVGEMFRVLRPGGYVFARSPDREDMEGYVDYTTYPSHVRSFDEWSLRLLFGRIFGADVVEVHVINTELLIVVRKP